MSDLSQDPRINTLIKKQVLINKIKREVERVESEESPLSAVELVPASSVRVRPLEWRWDGRLLRGGLALLEGPPEKGKSTILCDLAARESAGVAYPGEARGREPGSVVMLCAEDDPETVVVPRLIAAGADLARVHLLAATRDERGELVPFHLSDDWERLRSRCREVGATLVMVDPLVAYLGSRRGRMVDTGNDMQVRKALLPLKEMAEDLRACAVAVRHHRKGRGTDAIEAGGGSIAFSALARVVLAALPDPEDPERYLFAVAKNNLVPRERRPAYAYRIVPSDRDATIGRIAWGEAVAASAGEILQAHADKDADRESPSAARARELLAELLASGEWVPAAAAREAGEARGLSPQALGAARERLGVQVRKRGRGAWYWRLPRPGTEQLDLPGEEP